MPSNECTTSLMELGFAVGNMAGAAVCDGDDYKQIGDILEAWQCRKTGDTGKLLLEFDGLVTLAQEECKTGECPAIRCVHVWQLFNSLVKEVHDVPLEGHVLRGPIPPKVKGPKGIGRVRRGAVPPYAPPKPEGQGGQSGQTEGQTEGQQPLAAAWTRPSRGMGYGDEERRKRWYPARA